MKQPKINEEVELTLKFKVEEATKEPLCKGCWGDKDFIKCLTILDKLGTCLGVYRPDKKNVIFKLIK
jgi:hypothetical protein